MYLFIFIYRPEYLRNFVSSRTFFCQLRSSKSKCILNGHHLSLECCSFVPNNLFSFFCFTFIKPLCLSRFFALLKLIFKRINKVKLNIVSSEPIRIQRLKNISTVPLSWTCKLRRIGYALYGIIYMREQQVGFQPSLQNLFFTIFLQHCIFIFDVPCASNMMHPVSVKFSQTLFLIMYQNHSENQEDN